MKDFRLKRNAAACSDCGKIIESFHRHDFVVHKCDTAEFFLDGGLAYLRAGGDLSKMVDLSEYENEET